MSTLADDMGQKTMELLKEAPGRAKEGIETTKQAVKEVKSLNDWGKKVAEAARKKYRDRKGGERDRGDR